MARKKPAAETGPTLFDTPVEILPPESPPSESPSCTLPAPVVVPMEQTTGVSAISSPSLVPQNFPESWLAAVGEEFAKPYFAQLRQFVIDERRQFDIFPAATEVFAAFRMTPLDRVRVVLLGQDPYPTPGHAHGLCFSVRHGVRPPASLQNIYREMETDLGIAAAKHGNLVHWTSQGVLLLNTVLTVRSGAPASHKGQGWEIFTDAALAAVNALPGPIVFVLWGSHAQKKASSIDSTRHVIFRGVHPSPMSAANGFFGSRPFSRVNTALEQAGLPPIDWRLPDACS